MARASGFTEQTRTSCLVSDFDALARELFMKAKLYQGLNRVQHLLGSLERFKKIR